MKPWIMTSILVLAGALSGCGASKTPLEHPVAGGLPEFAKREKKINDKDVLTLKAEPLKLTHFSQSWKNNDLAKDSGVENYLRVQKRFAFPIQFNGWIRTDLLAHIATEDCAQTETGGPQFWLQDDHGGNVHIDVGQRVEVSLERLYVLVVTQENPAACPAVRVQFGVLYGMDE